MISDYYQELLALTGLLPKKMSSHELLLSDDKALPDIGDISQLTIRNMVLHERYDIKQDMFEYQEHYLNGLRREKI